MQKHILNNIFKENLKYLPKWEGALANHVSMAAVALFKMKEWVPIDDSKIEEEAHRYMENLSLLRVNSSSIDISKLSWDLQKSLLGYDEYYESWKRFFLQQFSNNDPKIIIGLWLERLGVGLSAAAGHSVIRLAYALMAEPYLEKEVYIEEIAICLADYTSRYFPLSNEKIETNSSREIALDQFILEHSSLSDEKLSLLDSCNLIEDKYFLCRNFSEFHDSIKQVNTEINFKEVFRSLASIGVTNPNFALLHCITLGHAILHIKNNIPEINMSSVYHGYRDFVIAAVLCNNLQVRSFENNDVTLNEVYHQVSNLENDHSQKIVFTLTELYKQHPSPIYLQAALSYAKRYQ